MLHLPKIGLRNLKTAITVLICSLLSLLMRGELSFYAAIAAILCMQQDVEGSIRVGRNRMVGTLLGGFYGFLILLLINNTFFADLPAAKAALIAVALVPLIYLSVLIKKPNATYITCVVFLSVVISHGSDKIPYLFALERIFETLLGIVVSICVNRLLPGGKPEEQTPEKNAAGRDGLL